MLWLWAEKTAEDLIVTSRFAVPPATFEFRATRDVLALTLFLSGVDESADRVPAGTLALVRACLAGTPHWLTWCQLRLATPDSGTPPAETALARKAWRWLARGRLLAATDRSTPTPGGPGEPAWRAGLGRARRILDGHLAR